MPAPLGADRILIVEATSGPRTGWRLAMLATSLPFLAIAAWEFLSGYATYGQPMVDFLGYRESAERWLTGGSFYYPWQLAGPYAVWNHDGAVLYPPTILLLLVPFSFLPPALWVAIPVGITAIVIVHHRPDPVTWPFLAMAFAWPTTSMAIAHGNPTLFIVAALSLGTVWGWPSVGVLLKPSLFPFAFLGANRRSWWIALGIGALMSLPFAGMWLDWLKAITGATDIGLNYSMKEIPTMMLPLVAWLGRPDRSTTRRADALSRGFRSDGPPPAGHGYLTSLRGRLRRSIRRGAD